LTEDAVYRMEGD